MAWVYRAVLHNSCCVLFKDLGQTVGLWFHKSCYSRADRCHYFSLCQSSNEFHMAEDWKKRDHAKNLAVLLYIAHVLPQAFKSKYILGNIFFIEDRTKIWGDPRNFHANFPLDGWNDHIIQPARGVCSRLVLSRWDISPMNTSRPCATCKGMLGPTGSAPQSSISWICLI